MIFYSVQKLKYFHYHNQERLGVTHFRLRHDEKDILKISETKLFIQLKWYLHEIFSIHYLTYIFIHILRNLKIENTIYLMYWILVCFCNIRKIYTVLLVLQYYGYYVDVEDNEDDKERGYEGKSYILYLIMNLFDK